MSAVTRPPGTTTPAAVVRSVVRVIASFPWRNWRLVIGACGLLLFTLVAVAAPLVAPHDPLLAFRGHELQGPSSEFLFGTDELGRDILSRVIYGARVSLFVGALATLIGGVGGVAAGVVAGYRGGWSAAVLMRSADAMLALPPIIVGIMLAAFLGPNTRNVAIALGIAVMPGFARVTRAITIQERGKDYIAASVIGGSKTRQVILEHILPNALGPILVQATLTMGLAVLVEAGLSFLGLGTQPPSPSWGRMVADSRPYLESAPWYPILPGAVIVVFVLLLNMLADGLRDTIDPHGITRRVAR